MPVEIEHKFLINESLWQKVVPHDQLKIRQAYLLSDPEKTIRVRVIGKHAFITIKGKTKGASRAEYEYEIPIEDALELIRNFCTNLIEKTRHYVRYEGKVWEVDVFEGLNRGLILAELELGSEQETYNKPEWVLKNVTDDMRYANSYLCEHPYSTW